MFCFFFGGGGPPLSSRPVGPVGWGLFPPPRVLGAGKGAGGAGGRAGRSVPGWERAAVLPNSAVPAGRAEALRDAPRLPPALRLLSFLGRSPQREGWVPGVQHPAPGPFIWGGGGGRGTQFILPVPGAEWDLHNVAFLLILSRSFGLFLLPLLSPLPPPPPRPKSRSRVTFLRALTRPCCGVLRLWPLWI